MIIDYCYWERDCKRHYARQAEKEALESHSWKQGKAPTSGFVTASQSKANLSLAASSAKNSSSKPSPFPAQQRVQFNSTHLLFLTLTHFLFPSILS